MDTDDRGWNGDVSEPRNTRNTRNEGVFFWGRAKFHLSRFDLVFVLKPRMGTDDHGWDGGCEWSTKDTKYHEMRVGFCRRARFDLSRCECGAIVVSWWCLKLRMNTGGS